jgi:hypothetical protein
MTLPCAVEPDERRVPSAQLKPDPSKVAAAPDAAPADPAELAPALTEEAADPAAEVPAATADDAVVELLSLPQALSVSAPAVSRAMSPLFCVIFTLVPPSTVTLLTIYDPVSGVTATPAVDNADAKCREWTAGRQEVNGR